MTDSSASAAMDAPEGSLWQPPAWLPPVVLVLIGAGMLWWNPDAWIHPLVDYGRELYVPWRITEGAVLYRDIAYFNGPLSPYFNALWFWLFGANMHVLTVVNVAIIAGVLALTYSMMVRIGDRFSATCAGVLFLLLFGFQHTDYLGNFSWVAPYSHEMTHGIGLTVLAVWLVSRYVARPSTILLVGTGLTLGAVFLAKPEVFAAAVLAVGVGLTAKVIASGVGFGPLLHQLVLVAGTGLVLPALALLLLASAMPFGEAFIGTMGGWVHVTNKELMALPFYSDGQGTKDIAASLAVIAKWTGWFLLVLAPSVFAARAARRVGVPRQRVLEIAVALMVAVLLWISNWSLLDQPGPAGYFLPGDLSFAPILLFITAVTVGFVIRFQRRRDESAVLGLVLCALALGLLPKIFFNVRFHQYGFGLAFPATLLSVVGLLCWVPRRLNQSGWAGGVFRGGGFGLLIILLIGCMKIVAYQLSGKTAVQGGQHESFHCRDSVLTQPSKHAIKWLLQNTRPEDSVLVLPEGISINYFSRRVNPTRQINFMPPEILMYGEDRVLADLQARPADYCVLVHRVTGEYGDKFALFGLIYGQSIAQWVAENYIGVARFGVMPLHPDRLKDTKIEWGVAIMKRK